jgi:hypothetical protein
MGDAAGRAETHRWKGSALLQQGDSKAGAQWLEEAVRLATQLAIPLLEAEASRALGELHAAQGDREASLRWLTRAESGFSTLGARRELAAVHRLKAEMG